MIPIWLCKRPEMHYNLDKNKEIQDELHLQNSLQRQIKKILPPKAISQAISKIEGDISKPKAAETEIERDRSEPYSSRIVSTDKKSVLHQFWKYMTSEQRDVWTKKRQIISGPYGSGKTVLIQCKAADCALSGENVLVILPTHLTTSYKSFFNNVNTFPGSPGITIVESREQIRGENWNEPGGKIMIVSLDIFDKDILHYKELVQTGHVFSDELFWPPNKEPSKNFLPKYLREFLWPELLKPRKYYFWIVPHSYIFLACLLKDYRWPKDIYLYILPQWSRHEFITTLSTTFRTTKHIHDFIIQKEWQDFCKYTDKLTDRYLNLLFCTVIFKSLLYSSHGHHINGPPVRIFSLNCNEELRAHVDPYDPEMHRNFLRYSVEVIWSEIKRLCSRKNSKIEFKDIAIIIDVCSTYDIITQEKLLRNLNLENKENSEASLEWQEFLRNLKLNSSHNIFSRFKPENKENSVVVCNSDDIASLEWPVVIHVNYFYHHNYTLDSSHCDLNYFESYHNMIASRCTMEYIIICYKDTEDAWPHNNSFQKFKLWCDEKKLDCNPATFREYSKL